MTTYRIKGWDKFQHFKDRRPPWVKLYRDLLDDIEWHELDGDCAKTLISLWLIASENEGQLPETRKLAFRLRMSEKVLTGIISQLNHWLTEVDNTLISDCYQSDAPETETETEKERYCPEKVPDAVLPSNSGFEAFWKAYPRTPNMSKSAALKAWRKQKCNDLPQEQLLVSVAKYKAFLAAETKKNGRDYPAKHVQGWLNERRWEGFIEATPQAQMATHSADWADTIPEWKLFKHTTQPAEWAVWFASTHPNGSVSTLVVPSKFTAEKIQEKFGSRLQAHFGEGFEIKVSQ